MFGAEGIGLCRTEHMFFAEDRLPFMRIMILADNEKDRRTALKKLLPMQRADFAGLFKAMDGLPVVIRTLDPPLHEFLPKREDLMVEIAKLEISKPKSPKLKELRHLLSRVEDLHEINPMLGHPRMPIGNHVSGDHRDAGARHSGGGRRRQEKKHQGAPGDHDPAHQRHQGNEKPELTSVAASPQRCSRRRA